MPKTRLHRVHPNKPLQVRILIISNGEIGQALIDATNSILIDCTFKTRTISVQNDSNLNAIIT